MVPRTNCRCYVQWMVSFLVTFVVFSNGQIDCNFELEATPFPATLTSPNFPSNYPNNVHCVTHIRAPVGTVIELIFDVFDLEESEKCSKDSLVIDGGIDGGRRLLYHSCGTSFIWPRFPDLLIETLGHEITVIFVTDAAGTAPGYSFRYRHVTPTPNALFFTDETRFWILPRKNGDAGYLEEIGMQELTAIDFDPISGYVFYADRGTRNISKRNIYEASSPELVINTNIVDPFGLRLDVLSRLLYWTDANLGTVSVCNLDGTRRATVVATGLSRPGAIVTEPYQGYIYYTDWGFPAKIERAEGDGANRLIIAQGLISPKSLALDLTERTLYWIDSVLDTLQSVNYDGSNMQTLYDYDSGDAFALVVDPNAFIFTDPTNGVLRIDSRDLSDVGASLYFTTGATDYRGLTLRPLHDPGDAPDVCPSLTCNGLCLPKPNWQHSCVDDNYVDCNTDLTASSMPGTLTSPLFPANYPNNVNCVTHIRSPEGTVIELTFHSFDLEESEDCAKDSLVIDDGIDGGPRLLYHSCGSEIVWPALPDVLITTGNEITVAFVADFGGSSTGFNVTFRAVTPNPSIIVVAEDGNLRYFYRHNGLNGAFQPAEMVEPIAVDYDPVTEYFYFSDRGAKIIGRIPFGAVQADILFSDNIEYPFGMHIDVISRLLYWTDADLGTISVSTLDGTDRSTIIDTDLDTPGSIVTEPYTGFIYFTDFGASGKVERADGDGTNRRVLVNQGLISPKSLAMDYTERALYWIDAMQGSLQTVNYDGGNHRTLYTFFHTEAFSLVLDVNAFIFTDAHATYGSIDYISRGLDSGHRGLMYGTNLHYRGITLRPLSDDGSSAAGTCPTAACSGLCLPKPNNQHTCITDTPPAVVCPADIAVELSNGQISVQVTWTEPAGTVVYQSHTSGAYFYEGVTTVVYTFFEGGMTLTCSFTVTVTERDTTTPVFLNCPASMVVWVSRFSTSAVVTWDAILLQDPNDIVVSSSIASGSVFYLGTVTVVIHAIDTSSNLATCSFTVTVQSDDEPPVINQCPSDISATLSSPGTTQAVTWQEPTITDNSGTPPTWVLRSSLPGEQFPVGQTPVTYIASDSFQNTATCVFTVTVTGSLDVTCPADIAATYEIGKATSVQVFWVEPVASDGSRATRSTHSPGYFFTAGVTTVTYTFLDTAASREVTCSFRVRVDAVDTSPPVFRNCPDPIMAWIAPGSSSKQITWDAITLENANDVILMYSLQPGSEFYVGTEIVFVLASDVSSNKAWCNFTVTVKVDDIPPVINQCPTNFSVNLDTPTDNGKVVYWTDPSLTDNSGDADWSVKPSPGTRFSVGTSEVTYTGVDTFGNEAFCRFFVTVQRPPDDGGNDVVVHVIAGGGGVLFLLLLVIIFLGFILCRRRNKNTDASGINNPGFDPNAGCRIYDEVPATLPATPKNSSGPFQQPPINDNDYTELKRDFNNI